MNILRTDGVDKQGERRLAYDNVGTSEAPDMLLKAYLVTRQCRVVYASGAFKGSTPFPLP